jgi:hypothetical protein
MIDAYPPALLRLLRLDVPLKSSASKVVSKVLAQFLRGLEINSALESVPRFSRVRLQR